jgi:hypothetical protein
VREGSPGSGSEGPGPDAARPAPAARTPDPGEPLVVVTAQIAAALARRRERRREAIAELRLALTELAKAVTRHTERIDALRRTAAPGGTPPP